MPHPPTQPILPHTPSYPTSLPAAEEKERRQAALADAGFQAVRAEYDAMRAAIRDPAKRGEGTDYTQPWLAHPPVVLA